jgi:hypothetical protein
MLGSHYRRPTMRFLVLSIALAATTAACAPSGPYDAGPSMYDRAAMLNASAAMLQGPPPPQPVFAQPYAPAPYQGPRCYHVMANGGCAHWGP